MKKLLILLPLLLCACGDIGDEVIHIDTDYPAPDLLCRVMDLEDRALLLAELGDTDPAVYTLSLDQVGSLPAREPTPGNLVGLYGLKETVWTEGQEPPVLTGAERLIVEDGGFDDLHLLYLQVLRDLWQTDPALGEEIHTIGLDLQTRLTPAETDALALMLEAEYGYPVIQTTLEELMKTGAVEQESLYWEDGVLLSIREAVEQEKDRSAFDAEIWRSGLGAYYYSDCTALRDEGGHWASYQAGAQAIS